MAAGCRLIDAAQTYGIEAEGVRTCGIPRDQSFVTSKVAAEAKSCKNAAASTDETLSGMGPDNILAKWRIKSAVNQILLHIGNTDALLLIWRF